MAKILVVDDSSMARHILHSILETAGHQVIEAKDGIQAIEQYFLEKPDLMILDLLMIGMSGNDVLTQIRELDPNACVIIATADVQNFTRTAVEAAGASGFIAKPFSTTTVLDVVHSALEHLRQ